MNTKERIDLLMKARNLLHKQENGEQVTSNDIVFAHDYIDITVDDMVDENFKAKNQRNDAIRALASATMKLDRLQVELSDETPYPIPDAKQARERILATFDELKKVSDFIEKL